MSDFVAFEPAKRSAPAGEYVAIRAATAADAHGLAQVMAARGGSAEDHLATATRFIDALPVLAVAHVGDGIVGWSGAQPFEIRPGKGLQWLTAGLTVVPAQRRRGIAARLLQQVLSETDRLAPGGPLLSAINARNLASIALHEKLGFREAARGASFARIEFTGGEGVLLRHG